MSYRAYRTADGIKVAGYRRTMTFAEAVGWRANLERRNAFLNRHERDELRDLVRALKDAARLEAEMRTQVRSNDPRRSSP